MWLSLVVLVFLPVLVNCLHFFPPCVLNSIGVGFLFRFGMGFAFGVFLVGFHFVCLFVLFLLVFSSHASDLLKLYFPFSSMKMRRANEGSTTSLSWL